MWFKNLQLYRLVEPFTLDADTLADKMAPRRFSGCTRLDPSHAGWALPYQGEHLVRSAGGALWLSLKTEDKILPSSVIKQALDERIAHISATEARRVGRKEKLTLKEEITERLLPQAFSKIGAIQACIDPVSGWLLIDASNASRAELLISTLLQAVETIKLSRPDGEHSPVSKMTDALLAPDTLGAFMLDSDCELKGSGTPSSGIRFARYQLADPDIANHIGAGHFPVKLGLVWQERVSFMFTEDWQVKRLKFLDMVQEALADTDAEDPALLAEATLTLMIGELRGLLADLTEWVNSEPMTNTPPAPVVTTA